MTPISIRKTILRVLKLAKPHALPVEQLRAQVNDLVRPELSAADLSKHLAWMKAQAMVDFLEDALDPQNADARKWHIREAGEAALRT